MSNEHDDSSRIVVRPRPVNEESEELLRLRARKRRVAAMSPKPTPMPSFFLGIRSSKKPAKESPKIPSFSAERRDKLMDLMTPEEIEIMQDRVDAIVDTVYQRIQGICDAALAKTKKPFA